MPLYICSDCGAVDNTAGGNYWRQREQPLCTECTSGEWSRPWPKKPWDGETKVLNPPVGATCQKCGQGPIEAGVRCHCGRVA